MLVLGLVGGALASLAFQTTIPGLVAILWMVGGLASAFRTLGGSSYLTRIADPRSLGLLAALYALSLTVGGSLGNPISGMILDTRGFRTFGLMVLALTMLTVPGVLAALPRQEMRQPAERGARRAFWVNALELVRRPVVVMLVGLRFLPTVFYGMASVFIPLLINDVTGSKTTVAVYTSATLVAASGAQLLSGRAADRFGHRWPTLIAFAIMILSALGLAAFPTQLWGIFGFGVLGNAAAWALSALMYCLVSDGVPRAEHGLVLGVLHAAWSIAMICGSMLGASLIQLAPGLPFLAAALLNVGSIFLVLLFFTRLVSGAQTEEQGG